MSTPSSNKPTVPLELVLCGHCNLLQLSTSVDPELLYRQFWYRSGINESMRKALSDVVGYTISKADLKVGDAVLDIGANDGTMLSMYPKEIIRAGVDPSNIILESEPVSRMTYAVHGFFSRPMGLKLVETIGKRFKAITAIAMFYDLDDPAGFLQDCKAIMEDDGILVIQMNYLLSMLKNNAFDNICHEHLTYFSLTSLTWLASRIGLSVVDVSTSEVNGGSFRVTLKKSPINKSDFTKESFDRVRDLLEIEEEFGLNTEAPYDAFKKRVLDIQYKLSRFVTQETLKMKRCYAYGASTRGSTLLQSVSLPLSGVAERDERKVGKYMSANWLQIMSEDAVRCRADYMVVLPYHFKDAIVEREKDWLGKGGTLIFPMPKPHLVTKDGEKEIVLDELKSIKMPKQPATSAVAN